MKQTVKIPELLSPAGSPVKLRFALNYGADAVYAAGKHFGTVSYTHLDVYKRQI